MKVIYTIKENGLKDTYEIEKATERDVREILSYDNFDKITIWRNK